MPAQEVFDTVVRHLHTQGKQAYTYEEGCRYRMEGGLTCAVGCLITDAEYDVRMEGKSVQMLIDRGMALPIMLEHCDLLKELQDVHDYAPNWTLPARMGIMLGNVANRMRLNASLVKELYGVS